MTERQPLQRPATAELDVYVGSPEGLSELPVIASQAPGEFLAIPFAALHKQIIMRDINPASAILYFRRPDSLADEESVAVSLVENPRTVRVVSLPIAQPERLLLADGRLQIDKAARVTYVDGRPCRLPPIAQRMITYFGDNADKVLGFNQIIENTWEETSTASRKMAMQGILSRLRSELGSELGHKRDGVIRSVHKCGYMALSSMR